MEKFRERKRAKRGGRGTRGSPCASLADVWRNWTKSSQEETELCQHLDGMGKCAERKQGRKLGHAPSLSLRDPGLWGYWHSPPTSLPTSDPSKTYKANIPGMLVPVPPPRTVVPSHKQAWEWTLRRKDFESYNR